MDANGIIRDMRKSAASPLWGRLVEAAHEKKLAERGLQSQLAKWAGISQPSVSAWKTGKATPSLENVLAIAPRLGVCVEWILTGRGPKKPESSLPADLLELADVWTQIPELERRELIGVAKHHSRR